MKAPYIKHGELHEAEFGPYLQKGKQVTPMLDPGDSRMCAFITHEDYNSTVKAYRRLPEQYRRIFLDDVRRYMGVDQAKGQISRQPNNINDNPEELKKYVAALQDAGLDRSYKNYEILNDYALQNERCRKTPVFSVNGSPVTQDNMTFENISFYMGCNRVNAGRVHRSLICSDDRFKLRGLLGAGINETQAKRMMNSPIAHGIATKARASHTLKL